MYSVADRFQICQPLLYSINMVKRNPNTTSLTKEYIESKVSQELLLSKYTNIPIETIKTCIEKNELITSIFRNDDYNKSMGIAYNKRGRLKVRDFGGFGFFDDVYGVIAYVLSNMYNRKINTSKKEDFYFVLKHIANTFKDYINGDSVDSDLAESVQCAISKGKRQKTVIKIVPRDFNDSDKKYWNRLGVSVSYLKTSFVVPVDQYYFDKEKEPRYMFKRSDPCYAYILGQNRQGVYLIKLYFPNRDRNKMVKFITNCNVLEGLPNLERNDYDYILITKSSKDRLSIGCHLTSTPLYGRANIGIVNLPSENYKLKQKEYDYLKSKLNENGIILSLLDFDATGRAGAKYLKDTYNIPYIFITRGEFGLFDYGGKDFTDLHLTHTKEELNQYIIETIEYVELKYKNIKDFDIPF